MLETNKATLNNKLNIIAIYTACVVWFIFPTSFNGVRYTNLQEIISWSILSGLICLLLINNELIIKNVFVGSNILIYMFIITLIASKDSSFQISIARIAPVICAIALFCIKIKGKISFSYFKILLNIICIIIIIWNILTLLNNQNMINFVIKNYTQFYDYATRWQLTIGKPVFTFGVHNVAAFFYMQIYLLCYFTYLKNRNKTYLIYMLALFIFTLKLRSTQSIGYSIVMLIMIYFMIRKNKIYVIGYIFMMILILVAFIYTPIFGVYSQTLLSKYNGFIPRYFGGDTIFASNFEILKRYPFGIGFTIPRGSQAAYFGDSGILVYYTMGNIVLTVGLYYLFFKYILNNIPKRYRLIYIITVFLFELSLPSFIYIKSLYFYMFSTFYYKGLGEADEKMEKK